MSSGLSRRSVVRGGVVMAVGAVVGFVVARNSSAAKAGSPLAAANGYGAATASGGAKLADLSSVPVGGGAVVESARVVLVRDQQGGVHAFSATCTHQGCTVDRVRDGVISCPCHGSGFDATTGAVVAGPATRPLPKVAVEVRGNAVYGV